MSPECQHCQAAISAPDVLQTSKYARSVTCAFVPLQNERLNLAAHFFRICGVVWEMGPAPCVFLDLL